MFQTKVTFHESQTPEQRKAHVAHWRREDARRLAFNNAFGFWRVCGKPLCRRSRGCSHDMHACFTRQWALMPEEDKEYVRGCIKAAPSARSTEELDRAGVAARDAYIANMQRLPAKAEPAAPPRAAPEPNTRAEPRMRCL
jgi:hypothetical protein